MSQDTNYNHYKKLITSVKKNSIKKVERILAHNRYNETFISNKQITESLKLAIKLDNFNIFYGILSNASSVVINMAKYESVTYLLKKAHSVNIVNNEKVEITTYWKSFGIMRQSVEITNITKELLMFTINNFIQNKSDIDDVITFIRDESLSYKNYNCAINSIKCLMEKNINAYYALNYENKRFVVFLAYLCSDFELMENIFKKEHKFKKSKNFLKTTNYCDVCFI